jgi:hypothetical protein
MLFTGFFYKKQLILIFSDFHLLKVNFILKKNSDFILKVGAVLFLGL